MPRVQVIHQTDIFLPAADPDDHYDLASQFALAHMGLIDLSDVLIDWPPPQEALQHINDHIGDPRSWGLVTGAPAVESVAQLSLLTGIWPKVTIGAPRSSGMNARGTSIGTGSGRTLLVALDRADEPVDIHIVGSCSDVAAAAALDRDLFTAKCRRVYVNAGSSRPFADAPTNWNAALDPSAYRAMFSLPCPTYWAPGYEVNLERVVAEYSSYWGFDQGPFLDKLPPRLRQYFIWALDQPGDVNWFEAMDAEHTLSPERFKERRNMWSTAGFLHSAGLTVLADGTIADVSASEPGVFEFVTVDWSCDEQGRTTWSPSDSDDGNYLFRVSNQTAYEAAMTTALADLPRRLYASGEGRLARAWYGSEAALLRSSLRA